MNTLLIATTNTNKTKEIRRILGNLPLTIKDLTMFPKPHPIVIEDGKTFAENALKKAQTYAKHYNMITLADDSGLEVDALDKQPGIYSARFAGENATDSDLYKKILKLLKEVPPEKRTARFQCVIAICHPKIWSKTVNGIVEGTITTEPKGNNGFGYDPIFYYQPLKKTFAELNLEEKNTISHRANALRKALTILKNIFNKAVTK